MAYENLPGIFSKYQDGAFSVTSVNPDPIVLVIGTAARGDNDFYKMTSLSKAVAEFGRSDGTLVRGLYEVVAGGAKNIRLLRIGATSATLSNIGGGITVETIVKDADAGASYKLFWEDSAGRLRIWRTSDDLLVFDNYPAYPEAAIDENELSVTGTSPGVGAGNIGSLAYPLTLSQASGVSGAVYTAGTDGVLLSLMEKYEHLFKAYELLENQDIDIVVPMDVYLDNSNVADMTTAQRNTLNTSAPWASDPAGYPTPGSSYDALGKLFTQEYNGEWRFWWDMDNDGLAEIYPSGVGSADATHDCFGAALEAADFHEVNFGYQLADFCYRQSENNAEMIGVVGVLPPVSWSLKDVANWIGRSPTYAESGTNLVVTINGTGLLGNRWVAGRMAVAGTGLSAHTVGSVGGLAYGGFIATDSGWIDGNQEEDRNDKLVDIGKYLSIVGAYSVFTNPTHATSYVASGAALYAGLISSLPSNSAPTNKTVPAAKLPFRVSVSKLDALAGMRVVMFQEKTKGIVVSDAPTAARPDSDYTRLTTVRIVKEVIDGIRAVSDPFIGESLAGPQFAALDTAIDKALAKYQKADRLQRYDKLLSATPLERAQGKASLELVLVPAFELRALTIYVALALQ